jgi:hypothetical protein
LSQTQQQYKPERIRSNSDRPKLNNFLAAGKIRQAGAKGGSASQKTLTKQK